MPKECAYCGAQATTKDHIPPKAIFPQPVPNGIALVTVPSCNECNKSLSDDDKYFAAILSSSHEAQQRPEGLSVWNRLQSGAVRRPEERGFWQGIHRNIRMRELRSADGMIIEPPAHTKYEERFYRVLRRMVRGFFFKLTAKRLPDDFVVVVIENPTEEFWQGIEDCRQGLQKNGCFQPMANVFRMWSTRIEEQPDVTIWYMIFHESKDFLCLTTHKDKWEMPHYLQPPN